jgi:hypothetical protein
MMLTKTTKNRRDGVSGDQHQEPSPDQQRESASELFLLAGVWEPSSREISCGDSAGPNGRKSFGCSSLGICFSIVSGNLKTYFAKFFLAPWLTGIIKRGHALAQ